METFQHESIHAKIKDNLINKYGWNGEETTRQAAFKAMTAAEYPGNPSVTEHQLMLTVYLQEFKDALMAANGGLGLLPPAPDPTDIYLGLILNGYPDELPFIASNLGFSIADIQKFQNNYNTWIKSNQSPAGIFGKCP